MFFDKKVGDFNKKGILKSYIYWLKDSERLSKDKGGNEGIYISNGFFVDRTAPDIISKFTKKESKEDLTTAIEDEKIKVYSNEEICAEFTLIEPHLKPETIEVTITAVDVDGQKISELDIQEKEEEIKEQLFISSESRNKERTAKCEFKESANYTVTLAAEDKVGLSKTVTYKFTVDKEGPTGTVSATGSYHKIEDKENGKVTLVKKLITEAWNGLRNIVYKIFSQEEIKVTLTGEDVISPVDVYYYVTTEKLNQEDLEKITDWTAYPSEEDKQPKLSINKEAVVYGKAVDKAGNVSYFCTDGMITDNKAPEIELSIDQKANRNNFYNSDIKFSAVIEDKIAEGGTASAGLQHVSYRIEKEGSIFDSRVIYDAGDNQDPEINKYDIKDKDCVINAQNLNNNEVTLYVTAVDNAGNKKEEKRDFQIDTVKPEISVTYDGGSGSKYYNRVRTATITIKERNLDTKDVDISINSKGGRKASIGKWSHSSDIGKSDDATHTCWVVFSEDDEYQIAVSCVDKAGNKAVKNFTDEFIIDTTRPVISVSYNKEIPSQDIYFNEPVSYSTYIERKIYR